MKKLSTHLNRYGERGVFAAACGWLALASVAGLWTAPARGQCTSQEIAKLIASDATTNDYFGNSIALSGDTMIVGAPFDELEFGVDYGSAYVFVRSGPPGSEVWTEEAKLTPSDPVAIAVIKFGISVAVSGDTAVVGAPEGENFAGSAYVFIRSGGVWTQQARLTPSDAAPNDNLGHSVAVSGDTVLVGCVHDDHEGVENVGSAYVFVRSGGVWTEQAKLMAADSAEGDGFGYSVALSGETAMIGAFLHDLSIAANAGAAYIFARSGPPGGEVWTEQAKLTASDAIESDKFGTSVALSGETAVIGAPQLINLGGGLPGATYVFIRSGLPGSEVWTEVTKLTASDAAADDGFGISVALSNDMVVVGASGDDNGMGDAFGAAYVFTRCGALDGAVWTEQNKLTASDSAADDAFGFSVAVSGDTAVFGSFGDDHAGGEQAGSAYVFVCTVPCCPVAITASDAAAGDEFGISVAIDSDTAVVGARFDDNATGNDAGAAYVYVKSGPPGNEVWTEQAKLIGNEPIFGLETGNQSGISVDVSGNTAFVGSWLWPQGNATGLIYIFGRSGPPGGEVWTQQFALACPQFGSFQYFGYSLSLEGDTAVVGSLAAPGLNVGGQVFFYARSGPPGGESWSGVQKFPSDGVPGDQFGNSVSMSPSQDTAIVGAWFEDNAGGTDAGSAYVFVRTGPNAWVEQAKLTASDGATGDRFGVKVAIAGDTAVVAAYLDDNDNAGGDTGSVYVFTRTGTVWSQQVKLTASDAAAGDQFGVSLALSGNTIVVGAHGDDHAGGNDAGSAYVFTWSGPHGSEVWTQQLKLTSPDAATEDWFGVAVALDGNTPVIGARQDDHAGGVNAGSAYVYNLNCLPAICCPGDFDTNNVVTATDIPDFVAALLSGGPCPVPPACCIGDLNSDGLMDGADVSGFIAKLLAGGACP